MKKNLFLLLLIILIYSQLYSQWVTVPIPFNGTNQKAHDVSFINADVGYMNVSLMGNDFKPLSIFKTTNKGLSWFSKGNLGATVGSVSGPAMKFINENTGFVATIQSDINYVKRMVVYKTTDGCNNWNSYTIENITSVLATPLCKIEFVSENIGYITTMYDIYQSTNGGSTWVQRTNNNPVDAYYILCMKKSETNSNTIYAAGGKYGYGGQYDIPIILKSVDGGISFQTIVNGSTSGVKGIFDMSVVINNGADVLKLVYKGGVAEYSNNNLFILANSLQNISFFNFLQFWNNSKGVLAVTVSFNGGQSSEDRIIRTTDGGYTWDLDNYEYGAGTRTLQYFSTVGDVFYTTSTRTGASNENNTFFHVRKININLFAKSNYLTNTPNISMQFAGNNYSPLPYYGVEIWGGTNDNVSIAQNPIGTQDVFYKWNNNNMNPTLSFALGNPYYIDKGDVVANYKSQLASNDINAISNVNQTKVIRDASGIIHQVHSSMEGIFYSVSINNGTNFEREEVVNGGTNFLEFNRTDVTSSLGNKNPSLNEIHYSAPGDDSPDAFKITSVWERYDHPTNTTDILCAVRSLSPGVLWGNWGRFGNNPSQLDGKITSFNSSPNDNSKPDVYSMYISGESADVRNFFMIVPHLEPTANGNKLIVSSRYKNFPGLDYEDLRIGGTNFETNDFVIVYDNVTDYSVTYQPLTYYDQKAVYLYFTYKKNGYIYYERDLIYLTYCDIKREEIPFEEREKHISTHDDQSLRNTPDITLRNGLPTITYQGMNDVTRVINYEGSTNSDNILLHYYPIFVKMRDANGDWLSYYYNSNGFQTQENPDIEGSTNYDAFMINYSKANSTFYQFVKINGITGYSCSPGYFTGKDAKFIKGSYTGQFGEGSYPGLLTLSNPVNSLYNIGKQLFSITNAPSDGFTNLDGTIEKDNILYSFTLGPIITSHTTYGFGDETPPQTVQNPVEFNETMVSDTFSLSNDDTLIIGAHGKYTALSEQTIQPLKYHVDLVNSTTSQIHRELFTDTINVEDSISIDFLRGYVIDNISNGSDQFYVQMIIDTVDGGDGDYMMSGGYMDNSTEGDAPHNYKTKIFFENRSNSLTTGNQIPKNYELSQNYPNPFNPVTKINFSISKPGFVSLKVYDITGREIKVLVNEVKQSGNYTVDFNGSVFASGVYFYRIQSGDFTSVKRMVLIK